MYLEVLVSSQSNLRHLRWERDRRAFVCCGDAKSECSDLAASGAFRRACRSFSKHPQVPRNRVRLATVTKVTRQDEPQAFHHPRELGSGGKLR